MDDCRCFRSKVEKLELEVEPEDVNELPYLLKTSKDKQLVVGYEGPEQVAS